MEPRHSSPDNFFGQKSRKTEISPIRKPAPIHVFSAQTKANLNTLDPTLSPIYDHSTKSLSCLVSQNQSSIYEELGNLELQIKDINHKLKSNLSILGHKQEKTKELEFKLNEMQEKTMHTEISIIQNETKCVICHLDCISF